MKLSTWNVNGIRASLNKGLREYLLGSDADIICLQEVRAANRKEASYFTGWPDLPQAEFLAPEGYEAAYRTNAVTKHGEHGNALLSRWPIIACKHEDVSDHRFEQRGLLHAELRVLGAPLHVVVVHFGLIPASRLRQTIHLRRYIAREIPLDEALVVAGDFNDWGTRVQRLLHVDALKSFEGERTRTYPSRFPVAQLDHIYARGMLPLSLQAPRGRVWWRMSDHLPLIAEFQLAAHRQ